jgi:hypothetical protein
VYNEGTGGDASQPGVVMHDGSKEDRLNGCDGFVLDCHFNVVGPAPDA